jgi:hypothetical protein
LRAGEFRDSGFNALASPGMTTSGLLLGASSGQKFWHFAGTKPLRRD